MQLSKEKRVTGVRRARRRARVRFSLRGTLARPRLSVHRSSKHIFAQLIDDERQRTLLGLGDNQLSQPRGLSKTVMAREVGRLLAELAVKGGISKVVFDRGPYLYHGRVRGLAEGARHGGLSF